MKYKVGDLVRVKENLQAYKVYGPATFVGSMEQHKNKTFSVLEIVNYKAGVYRLNGTGMWCFSDEMLEPAIKPVKSHERKFVVDEQRGFKSIYINGVTIAVPVETPVGIAIKNPADEYDEERGKSLAYYRMEGQE